MSEIPLVPTNLDSRVHQIKNILVVDRYPCFLRFAERSFAAWAKKSWRVFTAEQYDSVVPIVVEQWIDAVVIDFDMPGEDSMEFLYLLHSNFPTLPKIVLTEAPTPALREQCLENGAVAYLEKPKCVEEMKMLFAKLTNLLNRGVSHGFRGMVWVSGLQEILQLECLNRRSGVLELTTGGEPGRVFIKDGEILHSEIGQLQGKSALQRILGLKGGEFYVSPYREPARITIAEPWDVLLLDAAHQQDQDDAAFYKIEAGPDRKVA